MWVMHACIQAWVIPAVLFEACNAHEMSWCNVMEDAFIMAKKARK